MIQSRLRRQSSITLALVALLATFATFVTFALAAPGNASAYSHDFEGKPANNTWLWDPSVTANWREGQTKLQKGYNAYLCVGVKKETWASDVCSSSELEHGTTFIWKWGTEFSAHDPLRGGGLQDNSYGNAQEIWCWFYEP